MFWKDGEIWAFSMPFFPFPPPSPPGSTVREKGGRRGGGGGLSHRIHMEEGGFISYTYGGRGGGILSTWRMELSYRIHNMGGGSDIVSTWGKGVGRLSNRTHEVDITMELWLFLLSTRAPTQLSTAMNATHWYVNRGLLHDVFAL